MDNRQFHAEWVQAARTGDQNAFAELYQYSFQSVYLTIKSLIKGDENTVLDLTQDTFLKAFRSLDTLGVDEKFNAWVKVTARNTALDWLRKKQPVLFSSLAPEDDGMELQIEDVRTYQLPEVEMDRQETVRLIREILDTLSDGQRMAISLYYYENMGIKEIARITGCKEGTVKSLLYQGRKKIEAKVLELEKKGTKLYSIAPLPFFMLLLRKQDTLSIQPNAQIFANILQYSAAQSAVGSASSSAGAASGAAAKSGAAAGTAAKTTVGAAAGHAVRGKIIAGILAAAVVAGGAGGGALYYSSHSGQTTDTPVAEETERAEPAGTTEETGEAEEQAPATAEEAYQDAVEQLEFPQFAHKGDFDGDGEEELFVLHDNTEFTMYDYQNGVAETVAETSYSEGFLFSERVGYVKGVTYADVANEGNMLSIQINTDEAESRFFVIKDEAYNQIPSGDLVYYSEEDKEWKQDEYDTSGGDIMRNGETIDEETYWEELDGLWEYVEADDLALILNGSAETGESTDTAQPYDDLIGEYRSAVAGELDLYSSMLADSALTYDFHNGITDDSGYFQADEGAAFYYAYYDIDQDGTPEFLFSTGEEHTLVDIWTISGDTPIWVIGGFNRAPIQVRQNGMILSYTEGGSDVHEYNFYRFKGEPIGLTEPDDQKVYRSDQIPADASVVLAEKYPVVSDMEWKPLE